MKKSLPFTPQQEEALNKFLKTTRLPKERERVKSLLALQRGKKRKDIAQILDINPATITEWKKQFLTKGLKGICLKPYPGNHYKLTRVQKEKIKWLITKHTPRELNCADKRFWTTKSLKILVKERFGIIYESPYTYQRLFTYCGFSCHKPGKHNRSQNPHLVGRFRVAVKKRSDNTKGWAVWSW